MKITIEYVYRKISSARLPYKVTTIWLLGFIPIFRKRERIV